MTDLEAANRALLLLGVAPVGSLSDATQAARVMNGLMALTKRAVLSDFAWPFALRLRRLVETTQTEAAPPGWNCTWAYPADAACLYQVYEATHRMKVPYIVVEGSAGTSVICTTERGVSAEFTELVTNLALWRDGAAEAFVNRLAGDAAVALTGSGESANAFLQKYSLLLAAARANSVNEEHVPQRRATHYIDVRG